MRALSASCRVTHVTRCCSSTPTPLSFPTQPTTVELQCTSLAFGGRGVCRGDDGKVVFVPFALPGERLRARITARKAKHDEAEHLHTLSPSPDATEPRCPHFRDCGGCSLQHLALKAQLEAKAGHVRDALRRVGGFQDADVKVLPPVPADKPWRYRNKVEFTFASSGSDRQPKLGLLRQGRSLAMDGDALVEVGSCVLQHPEADAVLATARVLLARHHPGALSPPGVLRRLMIRTSIDDGEPGGVRVQVDILTAMALSPEAAAALLTLAKRLADAHPAVVSVVNSRLPGGDGDETDDGSARHARQRPQTRAVPVQQAVTTHVLHGAPQLEMRLGGMAFSVSSRSFFQVSAQAEQLLVAVAKAAELTGTERVLDLFCGCGAMSLPLATRMGSLLGIDVTPEAVADAQRAAKAAGLEHKASFRVGDLSTLDSLPGRRGEGAPDVVIVDPARAGLSAPLVTYLRGCGAKRLVYVSCNPATQARDLQALCGTEGKGAKFALQWVLPVELFPHTGHVETVACLTR
jgi:23S rRNA (uracil1939-C5)-methyltransferase